MLPQVPPPDPASDFGIERTAFRMNVRDSIPGHGMREFMVSDERKAALDADDALAAQHDSKYDDSLMTDALAEDLANELPKATLLAGKRAALERTIASTRTEMFKQQQIAASALDKHRQLKISLRADEDSLDALPFE